MQKLYEIIPGMEQLPQVYLKPGELYVAWEPTIITTLLGSCVSVLFHLPNSMVTAVCHSMLPYQGEKHNDKPFKYVDSSIEYMLDALKAKELKRNYIQAKLFGGASITSKPDTGSPENVGQQNVLAAKQILEKEQIQLAVEKVGGEAGYKLYIRSDSGQVALRRMANKRGHEQ